MRILRLAHAFTFLFLLAGLAACGGGGGGGGPDPVQLALLKAILQGDLETTIIDGDAQGAILIDLRDDGQLRFGCAAQAGYVDEINGMHIHRGAPGVNGPIEVDLLGSGATFDPDSFVAEGAFMIDPALAAEIAATPETFYVNIHTDSAAGGLVRQQLGGGAALEAQTTLRGTEEVPVADATARGGCTISVNAGHTLTYTIAMKSPAIGLVIAAHIHAAPAGANGGIVVDLAVNSAAENAAEGTLIGTAAVTLGQIARMCNALSDFYVNVHTAADPGGVARGQLGQGPVEFWMPLQASAETTPPSNLAARGGASLSFDSLTTGTAHLAVPPAEDITSIIGAHVHEGAAGVDGPILIDLQAGVDYVESTSSFSAEGSITCTPTLLARMLACPDAFYVNFHTAVDPSGIVRGQLSQDPTTFFTALDGANEVPPVAPPGMGTFSMVVTGIFKCSFTSNMTTPAAATVASAHIHDADAGSNGPVLIDLLGGTDVMVSGTFITGNTSFTGRTLARLLAIPERFYGNMHTAIEPGGVARGQLARLTSEAVPVISYATPVTYTEGTAITNNVPTNVGGAVSSYSVSPALPDGLILDTATGIISGTPVGGAAAADYTITATNPTGTDDAIVNITVNPIAPTNLSYTSPVSYVTGTAIAANNPTNAGGVITLYAVAPALPAGLGLSTSTGAITGTPTSATTQATYTVTGSNSTGNSTFGVVVTVTASLQPPSGLSYATPVNYTTGSAIAANNPTIGGGAVSSWSISPALPAGLSLNTGGSIIGTPTTITTAANHTVTATNAAGSTTAVVNIAVTLGAPANLSYSPNATVGYMNAMIQNMSPTSTGGAVANYGLTPALPAGLSFSTTTGVISGTPTATSASTTYTITATNTTGSTTTTVTIIVY